MMTPEKFDADLDILGKYSDNVKVREDGPCLVSNVLCEQLSCDDQHAIIKLGWTGLDDRVGCRVDRKDIRMEHRLSCRLCDVLGSENCPAYQRMKGGG